MSRHVISSMPCHVIPCPWCIIGMPGYGVLYDCVCPCVWCTCTCLLNISAKSVKKILERQTWTITRYTCVLLWTMLCTHAQACRWYNMMICHIMPCHAMLCHAHAWCIIGMHWYGVLHACVWCTYTQHSRSRPWSMHVSAISVKTTLEKDRSG